MVSPTGARPSTPISLASERGVLGVVGFPQAIRSARSAEAPSWAEKRLRKGGLGMTKLEYLQKMAQAGAMLRQAGQTDHGQLAQAAQAAQGVQGNYSQIQAQQHMGQQSLAGQSQAQGASGLSGLTGWSSGLTGSSGQAGPIFRCQ